MSDQDETDGEADAPELVTIVEAARGTGELLAALCTFLDGRHAPDCIAAAGPETERLIRFLEARSWTRKHNQGEHRDE